MVAVAPYQELSHVNLAIIAFSLCRCCQSLRSAAKGLVTKGPAGSDAALFLRGVLMNVWPSAQPKI